MLKLFFSLFIMLITVTACQKRPCQSKEAYNGVYNAMTCDYKTRIEKLENTLALKEQQQTEEFQAYEKLHAKVNNKEIELQQYEIANDELKKFINEVQDDLAKLKTNPTLTPLLQEIKTQIVKMKIKANK